MEVLEMGEFVFLLILAAYFVLPVWAAYRASKLGHQTWSTLSLLSIFVGLGPIVGLIALLATLEPSAKTVHFSFDVDGLHYEIQRVIYRSRSVEGGTITRLIILFGVSNQSNEPQRVQAWLWRLKVGQKQFSDCPVDFYGRHNDTSLNPGFSDPNMIVAFDVPSSILVKGADVSLLIGGSTTDYKEVRLPL
jgi:hypothetical protein